MKIDSAEVLSMTPEQFTKHCDDVIVRVNEMISTLHTKEKLSWSVALETFDELGAVLGDLSNRSNLLSNVHPDKEMRDVAEKYELVAADISTAIGNDREIYETLKRTSMRGADKLARELMKDTLKGYRKSGIDKDEETRNKIRKLSEEMSRLGQEFSKNISEGTLTIEIDQSETDGLPEDWKKSHPANANGKVQITTKRSDGSFMEYAHSSDARRRLWETSGVVAYPKNMDVLNKLLKCRNSVATLLGYKNWAELVIDEKMIAGNRKNGGDESVSRFIGRIAKLARPKADKDTKILLDAWRETHPEATSIPQWEVAYLANKIQKKLYDFKSEEVRPYFEYHRVKKGILDLTSEMFGLKYVRRTDVPTWHPDVELYEVYSNDDMELGSFYLDMFPRDNKYNHFAQFTVVSGKKGVRLPTGALVCNFPTPTKDTPALLEHHDVVTMLHEFGHLIHHIIGGHTRWNAHSGTAVEWDFVEVPSQLLEEWAWEPEILQRFAKHVDTGEPIPVALIERMRAASEFCKGRAVMRQMFYAELSLELYRRNPEGLDTDAVASEMQMKYMGTVRPDNVHWQTSFGHLDGYNALYYAYMWSLVISKDFFSEFKKDGLMSKETFERYSRTVISQGGEKYARDLAKDFLSRKPNFKAYRRWLTSK